MKPEENRRFAEFLSIALAAGAIVFGGNPPAWAQEPPAIPTEELPQGSQELARGPVHEAFAKPVAMDPQAPVVVPAQPPQPLQEVPPAEKPVGAEIVWVPGYWAWDPDRNDFIWVSGCWRNAPPRTYWVPGYWLQAGTGWQWIAGFWKPIAAQPQEQIEYLPAPPAVIEVEPVGAPPLPDQIWVPGCWYWSGDRYLARHGYWITPHAGWVWIPSHYVWTPRGYIFSPGHWDYDLDSRGVLFAPAYFPAEVRVRAGFVFCPAVCVDLGILRLNLFAYPRYSHYCFGDYYDDAYLRVGIYPWFQCQTVQTWYDPLFVYDRWHFRQTDPHWARTQAREYQARHANRDLRPPRTYAQEQAQVARAPAARRPERPLVVSLKTVAISQSNPVKFERINSTERQEIAVKSTEVRNFREQRNRWEGPAARPAPAPSATREPQPAFKPGKESKATKVAPRPEVRATRPEQVIVPNQSTTLRPSTSRYIEKQAPGPPNQEHDRTDKDSSRKPADKDSRRQK